MEFGDIGVKTTGLNIEDSCPGMRNIKIISRTIRRIAMSISRAANLLGNLATYRSGSVLYTVPLKCIMETMHNAMIPNKMAKPIKKALGSYDNNNNYPKSTTAIDV